MGDYFNSRKKNFQESVYDVIKQKMFSKDEKIILTITEREYLHAFEWIRKDVDNIRMDNKLMPYCGEKYLDKKKNYGETSMYEKWAEINKVDVLDAGMVTKAKIGQLKRYFKDKGQDSFKHLGEKDKSNWFLGRNLTDEKLDEIKNKYYSETRNYNDSDNIEEDF